MIYRFLFILCCSLLMILLPWQVAAADRFWPLVSVDTMKYSRDRAREEGMLARIPDLVARVAALHPTHIAIGTPYDEEFYPVLKAWVDAARANNLKVWFRGNWSGWEGWFGYPKLTAVAEHHTKTKAFIERHPELFAAGDVFTPAPEPENGLIRDPRHAGGNREAFLAFLGESYRTCQAAMKRIGREVRCGYFSMNGDIARDIMTKEAVASSGGVLVVDHYVKEPDQLVRDIEQMYGQYGFPVVLGEFGAPIPDIHGKMTDEQQAKYISDVLLGLLPLKEKVGGVNYWTAFDGTTQLFQADLTPRPATRTLSILYRPVILHGTVTDQFHIPIEGVTLSVANGAVSITTDIDGMYVMPLPGNTAQVVVSPPDETLVGGTLTVEVTEASELEKNIVVSRVDDSLLGRIERRIKLFFDRLFRQPAVDTAE